MRGKTRNLLVLCAVIFIIFVIAINFGCRGKKAKEAEEMATLEKAPDIKERLERYSPTDITFDPSILNEEQRQVLEKLVLAAKQMDKIFWKQASHDGWAFKEAFEKSKDPAGEDYLHYIIINFGPYDRLNINEPFVGTSPKPELLPKKWTVQ